MGFPIMSVEAQVQHLPEEEVEQQSINEEEVSEDEEYEVYEDIDRLQEFGINVSDIKKLKNEGMYTIASIMMTSKRDLVLIKGMSEAKINKIMEVVNKIQNFGFKTGAEVMEKRKELLSITTGSTSFDQLLQGGIESQSITEVFGEFRTGKTQLCHTLCVTAQLPKGMNGGNGKVVFIDTEGTFRPKRIVQICERFGVEANAVLDNITYARAHTHEHQMSLLVGVAARMIEDHYALVIVDSATALFRVDFMGRGQLAERQQQLGKFLSSLRKLAEEFNVAVVITNQVVADPGAGAMTFGDSKKPIGGHIMAHSSCTRLYLRKGRGEQRIAKVYDSPNLPEADALFQLTDGGIADPET